MADGLCRLVGEKAFAAATTAPGKECLFYKKLADKMVACGICPRACIVPNGDRGHCGVRENRGGVYTDLVYDRVCTLNVDPIEKKPFYHYLPGTTAASVATAGCNFHCKFCQNYTISQGKPDGPGAIEHAPLTSAQLIDLAKERRAPTVAFTYSEPTVFYDYVHDTAKLGREKGVGSVVVSNGYINEAPARELTNYLTAYKVDLKSFSDKFYRDICGGRLQPVLDTLKTVHSTGLHLEIVVLIVPTLNDGRDEIRQMCEWVVKNLGPDVPMHFSRFQPLYQLRNLPPTPAATVEMARDEAMKAGVNFAYVGNIPLHPGNNTWCPGCKTLLIERIGFRIAQNAIKDGKCPKCGRAVPGVWSQEQALAFKPK